MVANQAKKLLVIWMLALMQMLISMPSYAVTVAKVQDLNFGKMVAGTGGTVTIDPQTGAVSTTGNVTLINDPNRTRATFTVTYTVGDLLLLFSEITIIPTVATLTGSGTDMSLSTAGSPNTLLGLTAIGILTALLGGGNSITYYVGGTLTVGPSPAQSPGTYTAPVTLQARTCTLC